MRRSLMTAIPGLLKPRVSGEEEGPVTLTLTATTTAPNQTLVLLSLGIAAGNTVIVDWGDSTSSEYSGTAMRTHQYASAGAYTVVIHNTPALRVLDLRDAKLSAVIDASNPIPSGLTALTLDNLSGLTWAVGESAPMPPGLTNLSLSHLSGLTWAVDASNPIPSGLKHLYLESLSGLTWAVGESAPMPPGLTNLHLTNLSGLTWAVGESAPMPPGLTYLYLAGLSGLTWAVDASNPIPSELTYLYLDNLSGLTWAVDASTTMPSWLTTMILYNLSGLTISTFNAPAMLTTLVIESGLSQAEVDAVLAGLYAAFPTRIAENGTVDLLGGGNAAPSGTLQAQCPPTTGKEYAYELVNDSCNVSPQHWASVTIQS